MLCWLKQPTLIINRIRQMKIGFAMINLLMYLKCLATMIPDLRWVIKDIQTIGDQIIVRGEATGTPTGEFLGAKPTGKSFKTMAIDVFTVKNGKLASAYHIENWMTALQRLASKDTF